MHVSQTSEFPTMLHPATTPSRGSGTRVLEWAAAIALPPVAVAATWALTREGGALQYAGVAVATGAVSALCVAFRRSLRRVRAREAALAQSEADLRMLLQHASDAIIVADADGAIIDVNAMTCRMSGYTREALVGRPVRSLMVEAQEPADGTAPQTVTRAFARGEHQLRRADGRVRDLEVSATRFPDGRVLAIARDVTERRKLEAQLRQAQRLEALGQLAGGVAHDFNNIVAAIRGSAELLLLDLPMETEARTDAEEIMRTCDRATGLTRQLLAFARRRDVKPTLVTPDDVVAGMERMLALLLRRGQTLRFALDAPGVEVYADAGQLEQVVMNLAVNARDAMPDGGALTVSTRVVDDPSAPLALAIEVTDTGLGIPPEIRERIFEPFFTTKDAAGGTGLGLATVFGIVEQAGGHVDVDSVPNAGTTFRVTLPVAGVPESFGYPGCAGAPDRAAA